MTDTTTDNHRRMVDAVFERNALTQALRVCATELQLRGFKPAMIRRHLIRYCDQTLEGLRDDD